MVSKLSTSIALGSLVAHAATAAAAVDSFGSRPAHHEPLTLQEGLSDTTVFSVAQDAQGRMWFGCIQVICRFGPQWANRSAD